MARKILLADDSVTAQNMGRKILADAGYDVVTVNNGSAALKRINEIKPDLIVLDVYMPGYSGLEVCQRLKDSADTENIPVLLTVGKLEPFKAEEARRVRADAHIVKPFEATELLTVIARLEDRMVPQQSEGARFSSSASGVERFGGEGSGRKTESNADPDTGWKSRLRFPSKKKKEEPEPEEVSAGAAFREFRKRKGQKGESGAFTEKAPPVQEPGLVPDIPRDITPEELDALSAVAAQLDGPVPAAENIAPLADRTKLGPVEAPAAEAAEKTAVEVPAAAADARKEVETPALAVEAPAVAAEGKSEVGIPVEPVEPASEVAAVVADPAAVVAVAVNTALFAQEPAPMDRNDEPMFASPASAVEPAAEDKAEEKGEEKIEVKQAEAVATTETIATTETTATTATTEASAPAEVVAATGQESKPEESKAEKTAQSFPVAASVPETVAEELAPSDAELAEALRLLTPAAGHADASTVPSRGGLVAGQALAEEAARNAAAGPRWVAEPVTLSPEEAAISLEAEMFRTFATTPASMSAATSGGEMEPVRITGVSAIAAAVENRLAEAGLAAVPEASTEPGAEHGPSEQDSVRHASSEHASETTAAETSALEAPAEVMAAASDAASPAVDRIEVEKTAPEKIEPEKIEAEQKDSAAKVVEEAPAEEVAAATFADAVGKDEVEATGEQNEEPVSGTTAAVAEESQDSSSDAGGQESMGKDVKAKSGKSNWHQIHTAPASAAASSDVETAKQERVVEEAPKAMAASASAEGGTGSVSATDASTIASIVDSVMADLRPKIVEEIAKKLAKRD